MTLIDYESVELISALVVAASIKSMCVITAY